MKIRYARLPGGWYPHTENEWKRLFPEGESSAGPGKEMLSAAGIVPHAGWFFSGELLLRIISMIPPETDLVVVAGGHMPTGASPLFWDFDTVETPFGNLDVDRAFVSLAADRLLAVPDTSSDNTVEVVMPALARLCPRVRIAGFRISPDHSAIDAGRIFQETAGELGLKTIVIGSTDLTHYGPNYGFYPEESLEDPRGWCEKRDLRFLEALISGEGEKALELANRESSACSAGGAVAAMAYARSAGMESGKLAGYASSLDRMHSDSFVGYGAVAW